MMSMTLVLAHVGNWLVSMIYMAPVAILVGALVIARRADDRRGASTDEADDLDDLLDLGD